MKTMLQTLCAILVAAGIIIELSYQAHLGFALITGGSLAFALSTKINRRVKKSNCKGGIKHAYTKD